MALKNISVLTEDPGLKLDFNKKGWWISDIYTKCLQGINIGKIKKVVIIVSAEYEKDVYDISTLIDVVVLKAYFKIGDYLQLEKGVQKVVIAELIQKYLKLVFRHFNIDSDVLDKTLQKVKSNNYRNRFILKNKFFKVPNKKLNLCYLCKWNSDCFIVDLLVLNKAKSKIIYKKEVLNYPPHLVHPFDTIKWIDDNTISLISKRPYKEWSVVIPDFAILD